MRIVLAFGLLPLALLAGCQSEAQIIQQARTAGLEKCNSGFANKATPPGFDKGRFCECLMEETIRGKSLPELEKLGTDDALAQAEGLRAGGICMARQASAGAPQQAPADPAAVQPVPEETVEEVGDEVE